MTDTHYEPWGRYPKSMQEVICLPANNPTPPWSEIHDKSILPFGNGRSYGDVCLNEGGVLLDSHKLNRIIDFDVENGVLTCESGVLLGDILALIIPKNWFLPVIPGTQFVTVGGAIANDVHGKNHHRSGSFGNHLISIELLRSDGSCIYCSKSENTAWLDATIGGLGLTGLISWAKIQLKRIASAYIDQEVIRYNNLNEFFALSHESNNHYEYTVAWFDCLAKKRKLGRGLFYRGNHAPTVNSAKIVDAKKNIAFPVDPPFSLVNNWNLRIFNEIYLHKQFKSRVKNQIHFAPFFFPLDTIRHWNRIYGNKGFLQYQCVIPVADAITTIEEMLARINAAHSGSFLAVLKMFGANTSRGLLSFPRPGITLALDFPNKGAATFELLDRLDELTRNAGGAVYPAKDARMSKESFQYYYPRWKEMATFIDPRFSSSFWRRVTE